MTLRTVKEIENTWIVLADGCRLGARIWLPEDAEAAPVPAILEYLPYRKNDGTVERDAISCPYIAARGYAYVRVDMRGCGESDGLIEDEYLAQELNDGVEIIAWLATQSWCSGTVGMIGISWGGFNGLQIAALAPPALKAIITICSTDDRYADDIHYMGGCLLNDNPWWAAEMFHRITLPPDPRWVGERWRDMWLERLENTRHWLIPWLQHSSRDAYWKHGSVGENFGAIRCPVYAVGGWADGYSNAVFRLLAGLDVPRKGLVGPWAHKYPHLGRPGPAIGFLQESLRWWDHWLKDIDTGIMNEPLLRVWQQDSVPPQPEYDTRPGRWVAETQWPSQRIETQRHKLGDGHLSIDEPELQHIVHIASPLSCGLHGGKWCAFGYGPDQPIDQQHDDDRSLIYDSEMLTENYDILGAPIAELMLSADQPVALVAVRLCDVRPDGSVTRVSYGLLNLTQRDSREQPQPLQPGRFYRVSVPLNDIAYRFPAGHRIRLAISSNYWPLVWPAPQPVTLELDESDSVLMLPQRSPSAEDSALTPFAAAESVRIRPVTVIDPGHSERRIEHDEQSGVICVEIIDKDGRFRIEQADLEVLERIEERYRCRENDPLSVSTEITTRRALRRGDWAVRIDTYTQLTTGSDGDGDLFRLNATLTAYEGESDTPMFERHWNEELPRRLV